MVRLNKHNKLTKMAVAGAAAILLAPVIGSTAYAAKGDLGVDNSVYQGTLGNLGSPDTKFNVIQVGGIYNSSVKYQTTYATQVQYTIAQGRRAHSYVFLADGSNQARTRTYMTQMLAKVQTPKGSIVAVDYELNATSNKEANTANIILAMDMIKQAGYTPVLYSYKPYLQAYVNTQEVINIYGKDRVWIASYKTTARQTKPDFNYFPTFDGVGIWQFADNFGTNSSGVDGNVDLTGVTDNGYNGTTTSKQGGTAVKTDSTTTAIKAGQQANNTPKSDIKVGDTVKVNYSANKWASGQSIPSWVKGNSYKVSAISGNKLLLSGINSWLNKSDAEILSVGTPVTISTVNTGAKLVVDGKLGHNTILKGQKLYNMRYQDGVISRPSSYVRILQKHLGVTRDGILGPQTIRAMQRKLGVHVDGILGPQTIKAWQQSINAGIRF